MPSSSSRYQAVLFDLDGTLIDTAPDLSDTVNAVLREHTALPTMPESLLRQFIGGGLSLMFTRALAHHHADSALLPSLVEAGLSAYPRFNGQRAKLYEGMRHALEHLRQQGIKCAVVTNKWEKFTHPLLARLDIAQFFDTVVGGDTLPTKKPEPAPVLLACARLGVLPEHTIMIGDSRFDVESAKAAGCLSVCVDYGYSETPPQQLGAEVLISSVHDFIGHTFTSSPTINP